MARTKGSKNKKCREFEFLCAELERDGSLKSPIAILYAIANGRYKVDFKLRACEQLLAYRYPKPVAKQVENKQGDMFKLVRQDGEAVA